jgi:hypothetical protein
VPGQTFGEPLHLPLQVERQADHLGVLTTSAASVRVPTSSIASSRRRVILAGNRWAATR